MRRHPAQEQLHSLTVKTLDHQLLGQVRAIWHNYALSEETSEQHWVDLPLPATAYTDPQRKATHPCGAGTLQEVDVTMRVDIERLAVAPWLANPAAGWHRQARRRPIVTG
jgi:hypothetical protein